MTTPVRPPPSIRRANRNYERSPFRKVAQRPSIVALPSSTAFRNSNGASSYRTPAFRPDSTKKETPFRAYRTPMSTMKGSRTETVPLLLESHVLKPEAPSRILNHSDLIEIVRGATTAEEETTFMTSTYSVKNILQRTFLPVGYPHTVRDGYMQYQIFDLIQGLCSYLRGQLAIQRILEGFGVGDLTASAFSGAIQWIVRDGASMLGGLLFSASTSNDFGVNVRQWRLFADVVNDIGLTLNMIAPIFGKQWFLPLVCAGSVCTSMCGVAAGATKAKISQHFAKNDNLTDLVAKEGTQETFVNILGLIGGYLFLQALSRYEAEMKTFENAPWFFWWEPASAVLSVADITWIAFMFLTFLHLAANVWAIRAIRLRTVNSLRFDILYRAMFDTHEKMSPEYVSEQEPLLPFFSSSSAGKVRLGISVYELRGVSVGQIRVQIKASRGDYILIHECDGSVAVILHRKATVSTMLRARCHAETLLRDEKGTRDHVASSLEFVRRLEKAGWDTSDVCELGVGPWRYEW